jgi:hypothetical protein
MINFIGVLLVVFAGLVIFGDRTSVRETTSTRGRNAVNIWSRLTLTGDMSKHDKAIICL